ncbi:MAG: hypothetical protein Q7S67_02315 [Telluria sp.]|nr:hypothetical protein [Telluria sp.]
MYGDDRIVVQKGQALLAGPGLRAGERGENTTLLNDGSDIFFRKSLIQQGRASNEFQT